MKKIYFILFLLLPLLAQAQSNSELTPLPFNFDRTKLRFGANLGLSMSKNYTTFAIGPQIGYQFSDYFMAGTGVKYPHIRANTQSYEVRNNLLGANLFGYIYPVNPIALFVQPEINRIWRNVIYKDTNEKVTASGTVPVLLVGAGFHLGRSSHITVNYDLVRHIHSPYPDTIFLGISAFF
jgi:hypothetical protein